MAKFFRIGKKIIELREVMQETQQQMATRLKVKQPQIAKWESGEYAVPVWALVKFAGIAVPFSKEMAFFFWSEAGVSAPEVVATAELLCEPESEKHLSKSVREWCQRNRVREPEE